MGPKTHDGEFRYVASAALTGTYHHFFKKVLTMAFTIGKRITLGFAATVIITATLGWFTYSTLRTISHNAKGVTDDALPGLRQILLASALQRENVANLLERIAADNPAAVAKVDESLKAVSAKVSAALDGYEATVNAPEDRALFEKVKLARAAFTAARIKAIELDQAGKDAESQAVYISECKPAITQFNGAIDDVVEYNNKNAEERSGALNAAVSGGLTGVLIGVGGSILAAAVLGFMIIRGVTKALNRMAASLSDGSSQVASAASQVSSSSQSLAQGASEQAASLEETSSALEEMSSMTRKNA
ncbi:MAG: chemotaxis protein, partial [Capsulimonas sp.]|nr:chemotaxis protein [Capsulimonas sp.]